MEHDVPTGLLDVANVQVNRVVEELRRIAASGRLITIEDIAMMLLAAELKNVDRQRELLAVLLAVTLQGGHPDCHGHRLFGRRRDRQGRSEALWAEHRRDAVVRGGGGRALRRVDVARSGRGGGFAVVAGNGLLYPLSKWMDRRPAKPGQEKPPDF